MTTPRTNTLAFLGLLALTGATFGLSFLSLGVLGIVAAMAIAVAKGGIVALFFMQLREHGGGDAAALIVGVLLAALLIGFVAADVLTR